MSVFAFHYMYDAANAATMDELRPLHRGYLSEGVTQGVVLSSGPFTDGTGALIVVKADTEEEALAFMNEDPFYQNGMVVDRSCREWKPVMGAFTDC